MRSGKRDIRLLTRAVIPRTTPYYCDWPVTNQMEGSLSECEGVQMYLPQQIKHELISFI